MKKIDALTRWLVRTLQRDSKTTVGVMARGAGVRKNTICDRLFRLRQQGVITGYTITIDPNKLGYEVSGHALISLISNRTEYLTFFEEIMKSWPEVAECYLVKGNDDFMIKYFVKNYEDEDKLIRRIANMENVQSIRAFQSIRESFSRGADPGYE